MPLNLAEVIILFQFSSTLKGKRVNSALPPEQVASSSVNTEQEMDLEADLDMSESELDDSFIDADWKPPEANFELQFESSEDEMDEPPKKKKSMI